MPTCAQRWCGQSAPTEFIPALVNDGSEASAIARFLQATPCPHAKCARERKHARFQWASGSSSAEANAGSNCPNVFGSRRESSSRSQHPIRHAMFRLTLRNSYAESGLSRIIFSPDVSPSAVGNPRRIAAAEVTYRR